MPSPFPGMDPFIEGQKWNGFHSRFIAAIGDALMPHVRPRYVVDVEEDIYLAKEDGAPVTIFVPEVSVVRGAGWMEDNDGGVAVAIEPTVFTLPMTEPLELPYLAIRRSDNEETVAINELLSPTNKSSRDGRAE